MLRRVTLVVGSAGLAVRFVPAAVAELEVDMVENKNVSRII
jgi:hypothetical protein